MNRWKDMEGFGVHTYKWVNAKGKAVYVKYHWKPEAGVATIDRHEATRLAGEDPDVSTRDLYEWIASGKTVDFELYIQIMEIADELKQNFDPLDPTKIWNEDKFSLIKVGKMVLNRNPDNYFAEVEQAGFCPSAIVPGIEFSADKLLQGRIFSYSDTGIVLALITCNLRSIALSCQSITTSVTGLCSLPPMEEEQWTMSPIPSQAACQKRHQLCPANTTILKEKRCES